MKAAWGLVTLLFLATLGANVEAKVDIGDDVPNLCWDTLQGRERCLHDLGETARLLVYASDHCESCSTFITTLVSRIGEVSAQKAKVVLLLTEGATSGAEPDSDALEAWSKHLTTGGRTLPGNFLVGASPFDAGTIFYEMPEMPQVPNVALVDTDQTLAFQKQSPTVDEILTEIKKIKPASRPAP